jgi:hypothetical protein
MQTSLIEVGTLGICSALRLISGHRQRIVERGSFAQRTDQHFIVVTANAQ